VGPAGTVGRAELRHHAPACRPARNTPEPRCARGHGRARLTRRRCGVTGGGGGRRTHLRLATVRRARGRRLLRELTEKAVLTETEHLRQAIHGTAERADCVHSPIRVVTSRGLHLRLLDLTYPHARYLSLPRAPMPSSQPRVCQGATSADDISHVQRVHTGSATVLRSLGQQGPATVLRCWLRQALSQASDAVMPDAAASTGMPVQQSRRTGLRPAAALCWL